MTDKETIKFLKTRLKKRTEQSCHTAYRDAERIRRLEYENKAIVDMVGLCNKQFAFYDTEIKELNREKELLEETIMEAMDTLRRSDPIEFFSKHVISERDFHTDQETLSWDEDSLRKDLLDEDNELTYINQ